MAHIQRSLEQTVNVNAKMKLFELTKEPIYLNENRLVIAKN